MKKLPPEVGDPPANEHLTPATRLWFWRRRYLVEHFGLSRKDAEALLDDPEIDWPSILLTQKKRTT
jgi:hypothetical protein